MAMSPDTRDQMFEEAKKALEYTVRVAVRNQQTDPLAFTMMLVHESSLEVYGKLLKNGGQLTGTGFALACGDRNTMPDAETSGIPADQIACMVSIDGHHKVIGFPLDILDPRDRKLAVIKSPVVTPFKGKDEEEYGLNMAAVIRMVWELPIEDINPTELRERVWAWRERVASFQRAGVIMSCPPSLDALLWEHGNGDELTRRIRAVPLEPGQRSFKTDFDLFAVILGDA